MLYCSETAMLFSASQDCTVRCWDMEVGAEVQRVHTKNPPLHIGCTAGVRGPLFSYCCQGGVDFWTLSRLFTLHCKLGGGDERIPLRQILVPLCCAPPYPSRALCVVGDGDVVLVAVDTGEVLTSFTVTEKVLCAEYCMHREILLVLTEAGTVLQASVNFVHSVDYLFSLTKAVSMMTKTKTHIDNQFQSIETRLKCQGGTGEEKRSNRQICELVDMLFSACS